MARVAGLWEIPRQGITHLVNKVPAELFRGPVGPCAPPFGQPLSIGLDRTGHMSFLTGEDRTPKFARQVLPDQTESGLIFLDILPTKYGF